MELKYSTSHTPAFFAHVYGTSMATGTSLAMWHICIYLRPEGHMNCFEFDIKQQSLAKGPASWVPNTWKWLVAENTCFRCITALQIRMWPCMQRLNWTPTCTTSPQRIRGMSNNMSDDLLVVCRGQTQATTTHRSHPKRARENLTASTEMPLANEMDRTCCPLHFKRGQKVIIPLPKVRFKLMWYSKQNCQAILFRTLVERALIALIVLAIFHTKHYRRRLIALEVNFC